MPRKDDHLAQADHNGQVLQHLLDGSLSCPDWVTTIAFYQALHLADAVLDHDGSAHPPDHGTRERLLKGNPRYRAIATHYLPLKRFSLIARCLGDRKGTGFRTFEDFMSIRVVRDTVLGHHLHQLQRSALKLLDQ